MPHPCHSLPCPSPCSLPTHSQAHTLLHCQNIQLQGVRDRQANKKAAHYLLVATASRQVAAACGKWRALQTFQFACRQSLRCTKAKQQQEQRAQSSSTAHKKEKKEGSNSQKMATKMVHKSDKWRTQKTPFHIRCARRKCTKGHTHTEAKELSHTGNCKQALGLCETQSQALSWPMGSETGLAWTALCPVYTAIFLFCSATVSASDNCSKFIALLFSAL